MPVYVSIRGREYSERKTYGGDFSEAEFRVMVLWGPTYIYYSCSRVSNSHSVYVWLQAGPYFSFFRLNKGCLNIAVRNV